MARPNTTPESAMSPEAGAPTNQSTSTHVSDEIVTGVAQPADPKRYAGFDWVAAFLGFAVAMFFLAVFLGIVAAVVGTAFGYRPASGSLTAAVSGSAGQAAVAGGLAAILLAYLVGGYAAGRVARFNGGRNGLGVVLWTVIVGVALGIAGALLEMRFGFAQNLHLGIRLRDLALAGAVAAVPTLILMLLGGLLGGALGTHYHRRVDRAVGVPA